MKLSPSLAVLDKAADTFTKDTPPCCLCADCALLRTAPTPLHLLFLWRCRLKPGSKSISLE